MVKEIVKQAEGEMKKISQYLEKEFAGLRAGRASVSLLDTVVVNAYGSRLPVNQVATITTPQPDLIFIQPWDRNLAGEISRAIQLSNLGLNPVADATGIRVPIPPLSEERRREVVRVAHKIAEQGRVETREARRRANDELKKAEKNGDVSEDEMHQGIEQVQKVTDRYTSLIDSALKAKEAEIME